DNDEAFGIARAADGSYWVTGDTRSVNFPTVAAYQPANAGGSDAFVTHLGLDPTTGLWQVLSSTYLGGSSEDSGKGVAVDGSGRPTVVGMTNSPDFPTVAPTQQFHNGYDPQYQWPPYSN